MGASFETYATIRIRGAMLDEIRRSCWRPRSLNRKMREIAEAIHDVETTQRRSARPAEVAARLSMPVNEYHRTVSEASRQQVFSLEELLATGDPRIGAPDGANDGLDDEVALDEAKRAIADAIQSLPERERLVVSLYYSEGLNLREIGEKWLCPSLQLASTVCWRGGA